MADHRRIDLSTLRSYPTGAEQFGERLLHMRTARDLSLRELADLTGDVVTKSAIARIEKGISPPSITAAKLLDDALAARGKLEILSVSARAEPFLHLPARPPYFVGRADEFAKLTTLAQDHLPTDDAPAVLFIGGPPGVGKTALALQWANTMQEAFDVVLYSALAGYAPGEPASQADILEDLLRGLSVEPDAMPASVDQRAGLVHDHLRRRDQRILVLLDNARDSNQVEPLLPSLSGATVMVTSRSQLSGLVLNFNAHPVHLTMMEDADAITLAGSLIADERVEQEPEALEQLVDLCGSLPLAVIVAAERVAADPDTTIGEHVEALADLRLRLDRLDIHEDDDSSGVRAAFRWSFETLPREAAAMFCLLSQHPGPRFCCHAAASLAGISVDEAELLLDQLSQAHLVEHVATDYFRFHDLLRVYAAEEASSMPEQRLRDAQQRLVRWFLHTANAASWALTPSRDHHVHLPESPETLPLPSFSTFAAAFRFCNLELPNTLPIMRLALERGLFFEAWRTAVELFDYLAHIRRPTIWIDIFQIAVDAARSAGNRIWLAEAQEKLAEGYRRRGDLDRAYHLDLEVTESFADVGPTRTLGFALLGLGNNAHLRGEYDEALRLTEQAVETFVAAGSWLGEATGRIYLGVAYAALEQSEGALRHGRQALAMFSDAEDRHGIAVALLPLARTCHRFGDATGALEYSERAHRAFRSSSDTWGQADALHVTGLVQADLGDHEAATASLTAALVLVRGHDEQKAARLEAELAALPAQH